MNSITLDDAFLKQAFLSFEAEFYDGEAVHVKEVCFSKCFEKRMLRLLKTQGSTYYRMTSTTLRKAVCIAIIVTLLALSAFGAFATYSYFAGLVTTHHDKYNRITSTIDEGYTVPVNPKKFNPPKYIPKGYKLENKFELDNGYTSYTYKKGKVGYLDVSRMGKTVGISADNENSEFVYKTYKGKELLIQRSYFSNTNLFCCAFWWTDDNYVYEITTQNLSEKEMYKILDSLE